MVSKFIKVASSYKPHMNKQEDEVQYRLDVAHGILVWACHEY